MDKQVEENKLRRVRRILFCGHDNRGSLYLFNGVRQAYPDVDCAVIINEGIYYRKSFLSSVWKLLRESSILFCAVRAMEMYSYRWKGHTLEAQLEAEAIPFTKSDDINGDDAVAFAREFAPDLLVSLYTMHIYKKPILDVPKIAAINSHPAILPDYRGLEVFFWAMANGDERIGSSVFYLTERVDDGLVLQEQWVPIAADDSMHDVYDAITESAAELFMRAIADIDGETVKTRKPAGLGTYYPMPTRAAVRAFRRRGRRFF
ncbi:formyl transferase [Roseobacter litoralis]|uniref:Formyl transferase-like protein n=1 Tax=Roseobacter litoralis (strain ATCC 49566 / DSM 6996 / JCM 21268 / NBRC 15278 / OCh 149) TaxID=391595 RepID=F7ZJ75_ROSLO|nr:formyl transferase [Roseobacter litoralis]AEI96320.1 formyl transferase-like protein [Roseobacter litoralis Och 149]